ncbi:serine/threonine kinase 16 [Xylogone sp. PMI_703]|nr:serine/threonine kinase 16 [Xylogone sp. PMI_703]
MAAQAEQAHFHSVADEVENRFHMDIVPGTEILTDLGEAHFIHGGRGDTVLIPQPNNDPHNPLNWSPFWKYTTLIVCSLNMFLGNFSSLSIAPMTPIFVQYFQTSVSRVGLLTGACVLSLGYANFIIIPCTRLFGRRPVALACALIVIGSSIWCAVATSYDSLIGGRVLVGIGCATSESLMPVVIADMLFLHERGTWMGIYFWVYFMGAWVGPIVSGTVADRMGWRWFFWLAAILQGVCGTSQALFFVLTEMQAVTIAMVIFFPETKYEQETIMSAELSDEERSGIQGKEAGSPPQPKEKISHKEETTDTNGVQHLAVLGKGYPSKMQQFGINYKVDRAQIRFLPRDIVTPIQIAAYPVVFFASCCVGFGANSLLVLNLLESPAFSSPVYHFSPASVGYVNFALMGGGMVGLATAGPLSDWISMKLTRANGGIREPEMRLLTFIPFLILTFVGMLIAGLGWDHNYAWPVIVVIGFGFSGIIVMAIPTIGLTYAVDSYKPVAGQIMVVATVVKNTFGFGMTYFVNDMAVEHGYIAPVMLLMGLTVGIPIVFGTILWFWGKSLRRLTRKSKVHSF